MRRSGAIGAALAGLLAGGPVLAQAPRPAAGLCEVPAFRGFTQPGGAQARMRLANTGQGCRIRLMADIEARQPFATLTLTRPPSHGSVTILPEGVAYRPNPGFHGADLFEVAGSGTVRGNPVSGRMRVEVTVLPPP